MLNGVLQGRIEKQQSMRVAKNPGTVGHKLPKALERFGEILDLNSDNKKIKYPLRGHALILNFRETDLKHIFAETQILTEAFFDISCQTRTLHMDSKNFEADLATFLNPSSPKPRIIYISCLGEERTRPGELTFCGYVAIFAIQIKVRGRC